ncbi:hypothetical protein N657DRAFT_687204 [Parathielavia appendiculata]|uniref:Uncharacterized protein n=1 Tax=Parathielavia appendiculata TaxID=2587402 RepID=A0AAN6U5T0_9PEZI|nr:hypothetical protein N657DRAFT_687204 [Parathielavia appendiculata]
MAAPPSRWAWQATSLCLSILLGGCFWAHTPFTSHTRAPAMVNALLQIIARDVSSLGEAVLVEQAQSETLRSLALENKRLTEQMLVALEKLKVKGANETVEVQSKSPPTYSI